MDSRKILDPSDSISKVPGKKQDHHFRFHFPQSYPLLSGCDAVSDYQVTLKAELEIRHIHDKMDHLLSHQWDRLAQIQEIQFDLLTEIGRRG